ncbi:MAG: hypothetical protein K2Z80_30370 [Xanthobacteraceae bacterium]|nr:hypothetical protein [Xanthobacteraceae bacterium]
MTARHDTYRRDGGKLELRWLDQPRGRSPGKPNPRENPFGIVYFSPSCTAVELVRYYTPFQRREWWRWKALWEFQITIGRHRRRHPYPPTIPCLCCGKPLKDWSYGNNQPFDALEFATRGHYPSSIFDGQPGELVINVCDRCLLEGAAAERVLRRTYPKPRSRGERAIFEPWKGPAGERGRQ